MSQIIKFNGGMSDDPNDNSGNSAQIISNFDALTNSTRLLPYRDSESGDNAPTTSQKQNFCIAYFTGSTSYRIFSLGVVSGTARAQVLMKDISTGGSSDLGDGGWLTPANNESASGLTDFNLFVYYKKTGLIYGARAGTNLWAFDPTAGAAFADTSQALTYTSINQGMVHSKDDVLYIPYVDGSGNPTIASKNGASAWSTTALVLPRGYGTPIISEYGNYLAIACPPVSGLGNSVLFLWDRDSSLAFLSESVDLGEGIVKVMDQVDGTLLTISLSGGNSVRFKDRIIMRYLNGNIAIKFKEFLTDGFTSFSLGKQKIDNRLYFMMSTTLYSNVVQGVFSVGRSPGEPYTVFHEHSPNNDTAVETIINFFIVGDFVFQSYTTGGNYGLSKTNDQASYTSTSVYQTTFLNDGETARGVIHDSTLMKKLMGITPIMEPMPAAGQIVVKYKKDEETSFTTILTATTDNEISHPATNIESTGATLPEYKRIVFRVESTGGAVAQGLEYKSVVTSKKPY